MANWRGYFAVIRKNVGIGNWSALIALFEAMGQHDSPFPMNNNHWRTRLDGDAVIYESNFDASEVTVAEFKALLAAEFGVPVEDILDTQSSESYAGHTTQVWTFWYPDLDAGHDRFRVERFGNGGTWPVSREECVGYLIQYAAEWESEV